MFRALDRFWGATPASHVYVVAQSAQLSARGFNVDLRIRHWRSKVFDSADIRRR
jgi:hypothetical protein